MLGAIIGDFVGSVYEFCNTKDYNFKLFLSTSNYTDDSVMTMAVASWLLSDPAHSYQVTKQRHYPNLVSRTSRRKSVPLCLLTLLSHMACGTTTLLYEVQKAMQIFLILMIFILI